MSRQWLLIVFDGRGHDRLLHKIGMRPSKAKAAQYVGFYSLGARPQLERHIAALKNVGLHGIARKVEARPPTRSRPSSKRSQTTPTPQQTAQIVHIEAARKARIERDREKLAREKRRQAEQLVQREANERAKKVLKQERGNL